MAYNQGGGRGYGNNNNYNPYGQANPYDQRDGGAQDGYGASQPPSYGQQANPYDQRDDGYSAPQSQGYNQQANPYGQQPNSLARPPMQHQGSSQYDEERAQGNYEMTSMNSNDPNRILKEIRSIDTATDGLGQKLVRLDQLQNAYLAERSRKESPLQNQVDALSQEIHQELKALTARVTKIKRDPESGKSRNEAQVGKVDRRLRSTLQQYQQTTMKFRKDLVANNVREIKIVHPEYSEAEALQAAEDPDTDRVFAQALMSSNRRGDAQNTKNEVKNRQEMMQKLERELIEVAQLFNDLEAAVITQEAAITTIDQRGEETKTQIESANTQLDGAIVKAKAARRKKWICLGIVVAIIVVVVVVVVVVVEVTKN